VRPVTYDTRRSSRTQVEDSLSRRFVSLRPTPRISIPHLDSSRLQLTRLRTPPRRRFAMTLDPRAAPTFERSPPSPPPESVRMTLTQNWPRLFGRADVLATALSLSKRLFALHWDGRQLRLLRLGAVNEIRVKRGASASRPHDRPRHQFSISKLTNHDLVSLKNNHPRSSG